MTRGLQLTLLFFACLPMGALYALAACSGMFLFYGEFSHLDSSSFIGAAVMGAVCGLLSTAYVVPLLAKTHLQRSVPRVFLPTLAIAAMSGITVFLAPIITFVAHVFFCTYERSNSRDLKVGLCPTCHYPLAGLPSPICPECGTNSSRSSPG